MTIESDRQLIDSYLAGHEEVFRMVDEWILKEIDHRYSSLAPEREDLCQEIHQKLLVSLRADRFGHRSSFRTYIRGIVHHTCIDSLRKRYLSRSAELPGEIPSTSGDPYLALRSRDEHRLLHRVLQMSPEICRRLWRMIFVERLHYREIGRALAIPPGTVKSRVFHCRRKAWTIYRKLAGGPRKA